MSLKYSPDNERSIMEDNLVGFYVSDVYIYDAGSTWETQIDHPDTILHCPKTSASLSTCSSVSWLSKRLAGLVIGSLHMASNCISTSLCRWAVSIFIKACGPAVPTVSNPSRMVDCSEMKKGQPLNWADDMQHRFVKKKLFMAANVLHTLTAIKDLTSIWTLQIT